MVRRNVQIPMYQARIPISGGGGVIDLSSKENESKMLLAQAIGEALGKVGRGKQQTDGKITIGGDGNTYLVFPNGEVKPIIKPDGTPLKAPKGKVGKRNITDIINDISKISGAAGKIPAGSLEQPIIDAAIGPMRGQLMEALDLEEVPGEKRSRLGIDWLAKDIPPTIRKRKRVESKVKERPPKPKEYPDAKWSKEHQMWTIVKNGRLMGVK